MLTEWRELDIFISMKSVLEYKDYHLFMQDYYDERKRVSAFSHQRRRVALRASVFTRSVTDDRAGCAPPGLR